MTDGTNVFVPPTSADTVAIDTTPVVLDDLSEVERQRVSLAGTENNSDVGVVGGVPDHDAFGLITRLAGETSAYDRGNICTTVLTAGQAFVGTWSDVSNAGNVTFYWAALASGPQPATVHIEWSDDASTVLATTVLTPTAVTVSGLVFNVWLMLQNGSYQGRYYRVNVVNGAADLTAPPFTGAAINRFPYNGTYGSLTASLSLFTQALLTRSILAGTTPEGTFINVPLSGHDPANSTTTGLTANPLIVAVTNSSGLYEVETATAHGFTTGQSAQVAGVVGALALDPIAAINTTWVVTVVDATHFTLDGSTYAGTYVSGGVAALVGGTGVFTGPYKSAQGYNSALFFVFSDQPLLDVEVKWSEDGVNPAPGLITSSPLPVQSFPVDGTTYYIYLSVVTTMVSKYYRLNILNGATATGLFEAHTWLYTEPFAGSFGALDAPLSTLSTAMLTRAVVAAYDPDENFTNIRTQGRDSDNSTSTTLDADEVFRGLWFPWQASFVQLVVDMKADVAGTLFVDLSEADTPVDGVDDDIAMSLTSTYDPVRDGLLRRQYPVQSRWYRIRYVNGPAAQASFFLDAALLTNAPGLTQTPLNLLPGPNNLAGRVRSVPAIPDGTGSGAYHEVPVDTSGVPTVHVTSIDDDIRLRGLTTASARQFQIGTTPVQLDVTPLANRRSAAIQNLDNSDPGVDVWIGHSSAITADSGTFVVHSQGEEGGAYGAGVPLWAVVRDTGGVQATHDFAGTTAGGTGTNPNNALTSNDAYATIAQGQNVDVSGYTDTSGNPIITVKICAELSKQTGQFETVAWQDVTTGSAGNVGTVATSTNVPAGTLMCYLAWISRESTAVVNSVTGLGLTWTQVATNPSDDAHRTLDVWRAVGSPAAAGVVTATFNTTATASHIAVGRYYGVSQSAPIQNFQVGAANSASVTTPALNVTNKGMAVLGVAEDNTTFTAGAGYIERSDQQSASGTIDGLAIETKPIVATGTDTPTATLANAKHYSAISVSLTPAAAYDPQVTLSYKLSAVTGATSGLVTVSNTVDAVVKVDITADRSWAVGDIANLDIYVTGTTIGGAMAQVDQIFVEVIDSTANVVRVALREIA